MRLKNVWLRAAADAFRRQLQPERINARFVFGRRADYQTPTEIDKTHNELTASLSHCHARAQDPVFRRSVVYICEHNEDGAMGLIVNKPMEQFTVENVLKKLKIAPTPRDPSIRLDKPVLPAARWRTIADLFCIRPVPVLLPASAFQRRP